MTPDAKAPFNLSFDNQGRYKSALARAPAFGRAGNKGSFGLPDSPEDIAYYHVYPPVFLIEIELSIRWFGGRVNVVFCIAPNF